MVGRNDHLSHSLVPLSVAVVLVRQSVYGSRRSAESPDPNAIATFIAGMVPIYEYWDDPSIRPRALCNSQSAGLFRNGGRELQFLDGRPAKRLLAVQADDVACVSEMLKDPERAALIRGLALKETGRRLVDKANELREQWENLRERFRMLSAHHEELMRRRSEHDAARSPAQDDDAS